MDRRNPKIGTAFPETVPLSPEEAATKLQAIARGRQVRGIGGIYAQPGSALSGKPAVGPRSPPVGGGRAAPKVRRRGATLSGSQLKQSQRYVRRRRQPIG